MHFYIVANGQKNLNFMCAFYVLQIFDKTVVYNILNIPYVHIAVAYILKIPYVHITVVAVLQLYSHVALFSIVRVRHV